MKKHLIGIITGFLVVTALMGGVILYALYTDHQINQQVQAEQKNINAKAEFVFNMREGMFERVLILRNAFLIEDPFEIDDARMRFYAIALDVIENRDRLLSMNLSDDEKDILNSFLEAARESTPIQNEIIDLAIDGVPHTELEDMFKDAFSGQSHAINHLNHLLISLQQQRKHSLDAAQKRQASTLTVVLAILAAAIVFAFSTAVYVVLLVRKQTRNILDEKIRFEALFEQNMDAVAVTSDGMITACNQQMQKLFNCSNENLNGQSLFALSVGATPDINSVNNWVQRLEKHANSGERFEWLFQPNGGQPIDCEVSVTRIHFHDIKYHQVVIRDISEKKAAERIMHQQAYFDSLTKLPNRAAFLEKLEDTIAQASAYNGVFYLLFIDLDRFKVVNDSMGHAAGDRLLKQVAKRILNLNLSDIITARLGGDEFTVILNCPDRDQAENAAQHIIGAISRPFDIDEKHAFIGASIGLTKFPSDGDNAHDLLSNADIAMYEAKRAGRNVWKSFTAEMNETALSLMALEHDLHRALKANEFCLHFQPIIDIKDNSIKSTEVLIRWEHPEKGLIPPDTFIPVAEETGLIYDISQFVLKESCKQLRLWQEQGVDMQGLSINLPASREFCGFTQELVSKICTENDISPSLLTFEITESLMMDNTEKTIAWLESLREIGVTLAIDDFGVGYSSLSYLKRFPIDTLKIDRSFVRDITIDPEDRILVHTIFALGKSLGLSVVAEGAETQAQLDVLLEKGDDCCVQGYLFAKPMASSDYEKYIEDYSPELVETAKI